MKTKRIIATALASFTLLSLASCGEQAAAQRELTEKEIAKIAAKIPDYSDSDKQFDFVGYSSAMDGNWTRADGSTFYVGEDLRTVENFKLYKAAGFTFMHPQGPAAIQSSDRDGFVWEASELKKLMDTCAAADVKMIVPDYRLYGLVSMISSGLVAYESENQTEISNFESTVDTWDIFIDGNVSEERLELLIHEFMDDYVEHPAYYGNVLPDEPSGDKFDGYAIVYEKVRELFPNAFLLCNILPPAGFKADRLGTKYAATEEELAIYPDSPIGEHMARWRKYIATWLDVTGIDYLMYDQYPVKSDGIHFTYLAGLQIAAEVCKEKGVELYLTTQSTTESDSRVLDEKDVDYLNNMLLGMGVKKMAYYRYYDTGTKYLEGSSFVNYFGEPNRLYYIYQQTFKENQQFAPTVLSFDYSASSVVEGNTSVYGSQCINNAMQMGEFAKVSAVNVDKEAALVSELYDKTNERYMYMIQNVVDPQHTTSKSWQTTTLTFNENYTYAVVWKNGESTVIKLVNNQYTVSQHPGQAVYVIPFNA